MRAIISRADETGKIADVGTTDRTLAMHYKTERGILHFAQDYAGPNDYRVEFFRGENIYGEPFKTMLFHYCPAMFAGLVHGHYLEQSCPSCYDAAKREFAETVQDAESKLPSPFVRVGCGCIFLVLNSSDADRAKWTVRRIQYCGAASDENEPNITADRLLGADILPESLASDHMNSLYPDATARILDRLADLVRKGYRFEKLQDALSLESK